MSVEHYNTLGVTPNATAAELRSAYLKLARANHPDLFEGVRRADAERKMQQINEAWNVLGVAHKRREYDAARPKVDRTAPGASAQRRGHANFRPFDDPVARADIDLDATPISGSRGLPRWVTFLPIGLIACALFILGCATMVNASGLLVPGVIMLSLGGVSFLMLPLLVMSRAERDPNL